MLSKARLEDNKRVWRECKERYGPSLFFAGAPTHVVKPEWVDHSFSGVFRDGYRTYAFVSEEQRRKALTRWVNVFRICEDPCR